MVTHKGEQDRGKTFWKENRVITSTKRNFRRVTKLTQTATYKIAESKWSIHRKFKANVDWSWLGSRELNHFDLREKVYVYLPLSLNINLNSQNTDLYQLMPTSQVASDSIWHWRFSSILSFDEVNNIFRTVLSTILVTLYSVQLCKTKGQEIPEEL